MIELYNKKENCCGCTACMNICPINAIEMKEDSEGFLYPQIDQSLCINCEICKKVCPFYDKPTIYGHLNIPEIYAAKHKSDEVRLRSTSGGMFTAISDYILNQGGVVFGASYDDDFNVRHQKAETTEERDLFRGSKYVQSDLKQVFQEIRQNLDAKKYVLFSGTPCQTAGLYKFLEDKCDLSKFYLCDIVCHGTPSPLLWREHINFMSKKHKKKIVQYCFRYKWRDINVFISFSDGSSFVNSNDLLTYTNIFYSHLALRPSCHFCKFTNLHRPSDITIADFWGIEKCNPQFDDSSGVSLVLVNTIKGKSMFDSIKNSIDFEPSNTTDCLQTNLEHPSVASSRRYEFWQDYYKYGFVYIIKKYASYDIITRTKINTKRLFKVILNNLKVLGLIKELPGR